ncbi:hypothetical protein BG006_004185 [Podila minutissima]|uniref:Uncharacterized protein n=1 Tax=Podila minutissima TaxID=64525 RepID=A0A9P5VN45_9FUNG|nr:hypothetical protein BG006_004185 [Podila minutissima]
MSGIASYRTKVASWVASVTSPSATHASGMLILIGLLAATTDAQVVKDSSSSPHHPDAKDPSSAEGNVEDKPATQDMLYYIAMGMLVSQGLIRILTWISERREKAAEAARKKDDDLAQDAKKSKRAKKNGLTLDAFEGMDEEALLKRQQDLAALGETASLLGSDSEDDDYEVSEEESSEEEESEEEDSEEEEEEEEESESEGEIERRRRVLAAGEAEIEE